MMDKAKYDQGEQRKIAKEYEVFKSRIRDMNDPKSETEVGDTSSRHTLAVRRPCSQMEVVVHDKELWSVLIKATSSIPGSPG